jgi:hypothetical protein
MIEDPRLTAKPSAPEPNVKLI